MAARTILTAIAFMVAHGGVAAAQNVCVESTTGKRPADADTLLGPLKSILDDKGCIARTTKLLAMLAQRVRLQRATLAPRVVTEMRAKIRSARAMYRAAPRFGRNKRKKYREAAKLLAEVWNRAKQNPAALTTGDFARDIQTALISLAMAHDRAGNRAASRAAFAAYHRTFASAEISYQLFGPEPRRMAKEVLLSWRKQGHGTVVMTTDDPKGLIFIGATFAGTGRAEKKLFPGIYQVFVKSRNVPGHVHEVRIQAGQRNKLHIHTAFERALVADANGVRLRYKTASAHRENTTAEHLRHALRASGDIVLVGFRTYAGRNVISGRVTRSGSVSREAVIFYENTGDITVRSLRDLGAFLAGEAAAGHLHVIVGPPRSGAVKKRARDRGQQLVHHPWRVAAVPTWLLATAGISVGIWQISIHGKGTCDDGPALQCKHLYNTALSGSLWVGASVGVAVAGAWMWWTKRHFGRSSVVVAPVLTGHARGIAIWTKF